MNKDLIFSLFSVLTFSLIFVLYFVSEQSLGQIDSDLNGGILSCDFVEFCSNPVQITGNSSESSIKIPSDETQTTPGTSELIPDVTSNISLIATPDLPETLASDNIQNPIEQGLLNTNESNQSSINGTEIRNQTIVWKNYTSPKHGITIQYPSSATVTEGRESPYDPEQDLSILHIDLGFSFDVFEMELELFTLEDYAKLLLSNKIDSYDYETYIIPIQDVTTVVINNNTFYTFIDSTIDKETDKSIGVQQNYFITNGNRTYNFVFTVIPEKMDLTKEIRDHMIESIKFIDQYPVAQKNSSTVTSSSTDDNIILNFVINDDNPVKDSIIGHCELMNDGGFNNPPKDCMYEYYDLMMPDYKQEVFK
jgi:hypothetical protein